MQIDESRWWEEVKQYGELIAPTLHGEVLYDCAAGHVMEAIRAGSDLNSKYGIIHAEVDIMATEYYSLGKEQALFNINAVPSHLLKLAVSSLLQAGMSDIPGNKAHYIREAETWLRTWWQAVVEGHGKGNETRTPRAPSPTSTPPTT